MRWFRFYDDAINDPKILRLSDANFRAWVTLLCLASKNDGVLPSTNDIALVLRMKPAKVAEWLATLTAAGLVDNDNGLFCPHNWNVRQFKSDVSNERVKRHRERRRNGECNVTETAPVTPPETEQKQSTDTEQKERSRAVAPSDDWPSDFGDQFWQAYPRKTEKLAAMKKLAAIRKTGVVTFVDLMAGVRRYAALKTEPQYTKHPTTWLNAGCWADETQPGATNGHGNHGAQQRRSANADFFAGIASVAADIAGDGETSRPANEEIPLGRFNING